MLKLRYLFENYDLAKMALGCWEHDSEGLDALLSQFRISSNAVYPFPCNGEIRFLRLAPESEKRPENIAGEMEFITYLRNAGYPAHEPILSENGRNVELLDTPWGKWYASVFRRAPGVQLEDAAHTDEQMLAYGRALGQLHALSARYQPVTHKWDYRQVLDWTAAVFQHEEDEEALNALQKLRRELDTLPRTPDVYGLVHYDFELDNVFWDENSKKLTVIDFDDGMYHWFLLDVDQSLDSLRQELPAEQLEKAEAAFLEGYRQTFPLSEEMLRCRPLFRRFVNLYGRARVMRSIEERWDHEPEWLLNLRNKLTLSLAGNEDWLSK